MNYVRFPNLWDLKIPVNRGPLKYFGIEVLWYGIIISIAICTAVFLGMRKPGKVWNRRKSRF